MAIDLFFGNKKDDLSAFELEERDLEPAFYTPLGAETVGWENDHQICWIYGYGDMIFCAQPLSADDCLVHPLARSYTDFLRLLMASGSVIILEDLYSMSREDYRRIFAEYGYREHREEPETQVAIEKLRRAYGIEPIEDVWGYVKGVQAGFDYTALRFPPDYYDYRGEEPPDDLTEWTRS